MNRKTFKDLVVREALQFSIEDRQLVRYDFAYKDPASGRLVQWCVETITDACMSTQERDERIVPPCKANIARHLRLKCGIDLAIANQIPLDLPRTAEARYV